MAPRALHVLGCALCLWAEAALAAPPRGTVKVASPPVLIFLRLADDARTRRHEQRLFDELVLVLDTFAIVSMEPEVANFAGLPLPKQIAAVTPLARRDDAVAVAWLSLVTADQLMLSVAATRTGRTMVRTMEVERGPKSEARLALAVRELLGTAYLFEAPAVTERPELRTLIESVRKEVVAHAPPPPPAPPPLPPLPPPPPPPAPWIVRAGPLLVHGIAGQQGPSAGMGGAIAVERPAWEQLHLGVAVEAMAGPWYRDGDGRVAGWDLTAGPAVSWLWSAGPLAAGPEVAVQGVLQHFSGYQGAAPQQGFWSARVQIAAGALVRLALPISLFAYAEGRLAFSPAQEQFLRAADGTVLVATPRISARWTLGLGRVW